jgi:NTE family protein
LLDAVIASGAVPGIFPPIPFHGRHYLDGGFYSAENADLGAGFDRILILALRSGNAPLGVVPLEESLETLHKSGAMAQAIHPD